MFRSHRSLRFAVRTVLLLAPIGCTGQVSTNSLGESGGEGAEGGQHGGPDANPINKPDSPDYRAPRFICEKADSRTQQADLPRLSRLQLRNSVEQAVAQLLPSDATEVINVLKPLLEKWPEDRYTSARNKGRDGFQRADQEATQLHADAHVELALALGKNLTSTPGKRQALLGTCATDADAGNDVSCVDNFIRSKGALILKGAISEEDVTFYRKAMRGAVASPEALADVVALMFASPRVLFQVETDSKDTKLSGNELAVRLAYQLWDSPPDADLWAAAKKGDLNTTDGYRNQAKRMLDSPLARDVMERFFRQWLTMQTVPDLTRSLQFANYERLVGSQKPPATATAGMVDDITGLVRWLYDSGNPMIDFLTERRVFAKDPYVLGLYGINPADNGSDPITPPSAARVGLITRPAMLASGDYSTHPIIKGVRLRTQLLCEVLPPAPADAVAQAAATVLPSTPISQRQETELITSPPGCASCHVNFNPLGFATQNFDSLGRERTMELVIDKAGKVTAELPIDTKVKPNVDDNDDAEVSGAAGLMASIVRSRKVEACFAAQMVRYSFAKLEEDATTDGCILAAIESKARAGASLKELMLTVVESPEFLSRRVK